MSAWRFHLLGPFRVEAGGESVADGELGNRKARLLLKLLAVRRDRHVSMDTILDVLWGDEPPAKAVENVATLVSRLRTRLGSHTIDGGRAGYRLVLNPGTTVDIDDAERLVEEAEARLDASQPALAATAASQALELLGAGVALADETAAGEWLDEVRRETDRLLRRARVAGWRASATLGQHRRALALAEEAVAADSLDEEAHRAVILAYHRLGEPGEALAAYEQVRTVLVEELGADPGPETQALHLAVLRGDAVVDEASQEARTPLGPRGLVGRDSELGALLEQWDKASQGAPACIVVTGENGIGKTTLVGALAAEVRSTGGIAIEARCYQSEESLFLQPVVEALRELVSTLAPALVAEAAGKTAGTLANLVPEMGRLVDASIPDRTTPEMERRRTFEAVATFLAALSRRRPILLAMDDVQNAGASTLELLHFVLRWDSSAHLLVTATVPSDRTEPVETLLGTRASVMQLGPLPDDAVAALARQAGHPDLANELIGLTKGHTLFVLEALKAVAADAGGDAGGGVAIPDSLRAAVRARVRNCGADVEEFLRGAVVAGALFDVEHVAELLGLTGEEAVRRAETALRAGLLVEAGAGYEFANDVIRKVLYDTTPAPTRVVRHRRLASLLAGQPEAAGDHAAAAADWETAVDHWFEAATRSLAMFANREAESILTRAFDACTLLADPSRTARVQLLRGRARIGLAQYDPATQDLANVQMLARAIGDTNLEATALEELGWCAYFARQTERAGELAELALRHPAAGPGAQVLAGRLRDARGDLAGAIETLESVADHPDPVVRASALSYLATAVSHSDRFEDALVLAEDAVARCRIAGLLRPMFNAMFTVAMARANKGDLAAALDVATTMAADAQRYGTSAYIPRALNTLSWLWRELGEPNRALDYGGGALEATLLPDGHVEAEPAAHARLQLAESSLLLGDEAECGRWLREVGETGSAGIAFGWRLELRRLELLSRLDPTVAEELFDRATKFDSTKYRALALAHLGRREDAADLAASAGSDLLVAQVAPAVAATAAADRVAALLPPALRSGFLARGRWRSNLRQ